MKLLLTRLRHLLLLHGNNISQFYQPWGAALVQQHPISAVNIQVLHQNRLRTPQKVVGAHHTGLVLQAVVDCGALEGLVTCLEEFDPAVKEAACYTLGYVAGHSPELAQQVCPPLPSSLLA